MYTKNTFRQRCEDAAKRFLHSVVVIDNEAMLYDVEVRTSQTEAGETTGNAQNENVQEAARKNKVLKRRPARGMSSEQLKDTESAKPAAVTVGPKGSGETVGSSVQHELRAWVLTADLADQGILCTIYRPDDHQEADSDTRETDVVKRSVRMAQLADIVVLDWELGDLPGKGNGSWKAREIVKKVLDEDNQAQGRLRLIAVYTAEGKLASICQDVWDDLNGKAFVGGKLGRDTKNLVLSNQTTRIVFLNKKQTTSPYDKGLVVAEEELPSRLIKEFAALSMGLIPSITLHSIAAIRETTHHLLATFNGRLDPAFVCHRSLLAAPQDSEDFILDLIAGELRSALSLNRIGEKHADEIAHKHWIGSRIEDGESFSFSNGLTLTRDEALALVRGGQGEFEKTEIESTERWAAANINSGTKYVLSAIDKELDANDVAALIGDKLRGGIKPRLRSLRQEDLTGLLIENEDRGRAINKEFARLTSLKREQYGSRRLPDNWAPRMTQGTIIRSCGEGASSEFLLCTQPRCDSMRLKKAREFPFLRLKKGGKGPEGTKQMLVLSAPRKDGEQPADITVWVSPFPHRQKMITFDPENSPSGVVEATLEGDQWLFGDGETTYEWIADLKDFLAQKICEQVSGRQGVVGLDEYEWLRRQGRT